MKKIVVVANKNWEVDALMSVITNRNFRHKDLKLPKVLNHPREIVSNSDIVILPRAVFVLDDNSIEVWCIQDLMDTTKSSSSSFEKVRILPQIPFQTADMVIAFGTANNPFEKIENGSVVVGSKIFIHNSKINSNNPDSPWTDVTLQEKLFDSSINPQIFSDQLFNQVLKDSLAKKFILPPNRFKEDPATRLGVKPILLTGSDLIGISNVNITKSDDYATADPDALKAVTDLGFGQQVASIETTHGLIRIQSEKPFMFISGIANRLGHFNDEVLPNLAAQNYTAAFNAGVVVSNILPSIFNFL